MKRTAKGGGAGRVTFETVREIARRLPGAEEGTSYGTPAFKVRRKLFVRLKEDGETIAIKIDFDSRDILMAADPDTFFITDHYRNYPMMLVRMSTVDRGQLDDLLEGAWRMSAPKTLVAKRDATR